MTDETGAALPIETERAMAGSVGINLTLACRLGTNHAAFPISIV